MKNKFINHTFGKIIEGGSETTISAAATKHVIKQLEEVGEVIRSDQGEEVRQNVLSYKEVMHALKKCLSFIQYAPESITYTDFVIYNSYAQGQLTKAEAMIDAELSHLGL